MTSSFAGRDQLITSLIPTASLSTPPTSTTLADLESHGLRVVPSRFCDVGSAPEFFDVDFVVKPCVGAGSMDAERLPPSADHEEARRHVEALHAKGRDVLLQPYVESVDSEGECGLVFIDGAFSHAIRKGAMLKRDRRGSQRTLSTRAALGTRSRSRRDLLLPNTYSPPRLLPPCFMGVWTSCAPRRAGPSWN